MQIYSTYEDICLYVYAKHFRIGAPPPLGFSKYGSSLPSNGELPCLNTKCFGLDHEEA